MLNPVLPAESCLLAQNYSFHFFLMVSVRKVQKGRFRQRTHRGAGRWLIADGNVGSADWEEG